jgi:hypothetical protein
VGYNTSFDGAFTIAPPLRPEHVALLTRINASDARDADFPIAADEYPSFYCEWRPSEDGASLGWDGSEKFYGYVEWLEWLIDRVFREHGYAVSGRVRFMGEEIGDGGTIVADGSKVSVERVAW